MRYRALSPTGDYSFGNNSANFLVDSPATVAQAVQTRLGLIQGEWFLDVTAGTPYASQVLGADRQATYDLAIQTVILQTQGVVQITSYSSVFTPSNRQVQINATIDTIYGEFVNVLGQPVPINAQLPIL